MRSTNLIWLAAALGCAPLLAHDMWIEPTTFVPDPGQILSVRLRVGQDLLGDPLPRDPSLINQFILDDAEGRKPIIGHDGGDPAGMLRVATRGLNIIGYFSNPSAVELTPEKFNQYLKDEGLETIAAIRARRNETGSSAHEIFTRCAKSLLLSGSTAGPSGDRPLGFTLELVAERNPYSIHSGEDFPVRLTYEKRPLPGALVVAMNRKHPAEKQAVRTDGNGRVRLHLQPGGMWLVKAVHMIPAPAGSNAQWQSFWASLTFEVHAEAAEGD